MDISHPYEKLTPDTVVNAIESVGLLSDARIYPLNSYENRVYQIGIEEQSPVIAKFYRPERWSDATILDEHAFALKLEEHEVPVVAPLVFDGNTLHEFAGFRFAIYRRQPGHWPELDDPEVMEWIGRFIGRIHAVGKTLTLDARPNLNMDMAVDASKYLLENKWLPDYLLSEYEALTQAIIDTAKNRFDQCGTTYHAIHGDCHPGNILWHQGPHFVDLDDCVVGPAIQDIWMLLSGERKDMAIQFGDFLEGYEMFSEFDRRELALIEPLRAIRIIHYSAWLARRWTDPAFPANFTWFGDNKYWEDHINTLRKQVDLLNEPLLKV